MKMRTDVANVVILEITRSTDDNYLNSSNLRELADTLSDIARIEGLRAVIVRGEGDHFCRGRKGAAGLTSVGDIRDDLNLILEVNKAMNSLPVPVIAAVEGQALGFGCGFSAQCDLTIAAENAVFALPEMSHGLPPLIVLSYLSQYLPAKKAFEYALTSKEFSAQLANEYGMVNHVVAPGTTLDHALKMTEAFMAFSASSVSQLRAFCRRKDGLSDDFLAQHGANVIAMSLASRAGH